MKLETASSIRVADNIIKYGVYALVFLMPLFFLPWTFDGLDFNKQALLMLVGLVVLFAWIAKTFLSGSLMLNWSWMHVAVLALLVFYIVATVLSISPIGSFWGWPQVTTASLLTVMGFCVMYLLVSNTFSEKEVFETFTVLGISAVIAQLYAVMQMFGLHIIPLGFAKSNMFNTVGSLGSLGFMAAVILPLSMVLAVALSRWQRYVFFANIVLAFLLLMLINYTFVWLIALVGAAMVVLFWFLLKDVFDARWMFLPMFFLIVSGFFLVVHPTIAWLPSKPVEVSLSHKASINIAKKSLAENPIFGSGPGTFVYDFAKYKDRSFNTSPFWNVEFTVGASKILTDVVTLGLLGVLLELIVAGLAGIYAVRFLLSARASSQYDDQKIILVLCATLVLFSVGVGYLFYNANITVDLILVMSIAMIVAMVVDNYKTHALKSSALVMLGVTFLLTGLLIFGAGFLFLQGQRYVAYVSYYQGLRSLQRGDYDTTISQIKTAANIYSLDFYQRQLATFSLLGLGRKVNAASTNSLTDQDRQEINRLVLDAITASNTAIALAPQSAANWSTKGYICQNLIGINKEAKDCAIQSYDKALELYPENPYLYYQQGNAYLIESRSSQLGNQEKNALLSQAIEKFKKALELKPDYAVAHLQLGLAYEAQGNTAQMSSAFQDALKYAPRDAGIAFQLGLVYYRTANLPKAQQEFERAVSLAPNYAGALYYLGLIYDRQGRPQDAITMFSKLQELNPEDKTVERVLENVRAGRPALDGLAAQPVLEPEPAEEDPSTGTTKSTTP